MPEENGENGSNNISASGCNFKGFLKRTAYNLSGRRSIGYILGVLGILLILAVNKIWPTVDKALATQGMSIVEKLALAYLVATGVPTAIDAFKGKPRGEG